MHAARVSPLPAMALILSLAAFGKCSAGDDFRHHVVGDDRGWDPSSDLAYWAAGRTFIVGDSLWFTYSAAREKIVEVGSRDEYEACDLRNPIRMYSDGLTKVSLHGEGTRYFASANFNSCKMGLKLPVEIKPKSSTSVAFAPSSPSGAGLVCAGGTYVGFGALLAGLAGCWLIKMSDFIVKNDAQQSLLLFIFTKIRDLVR
ncbi:hypothetical protein V2J09_017988 [Rumex salicifolius]